MKNQVRFQSTIGVLSLFFCVQSFASGACLVSKFMPVSGLISGTNGGLVVISAGNDGTASTLAKFYAGGDETKIVPYLESVDGTTCNVNWKEAASMIDDDGYFLDVATKSDKNKVRQQLRAHLSPATGQSSPSCETKLALAEEKISELNSAVYNSEKTRAQAIINLVQEIQSGTTAPAK